MYIISWYDNGLYSVVVDAPRTVFYMAIMLSTQGSKFKVTDRLGLVTPKQLGYGDIDLWLVNAEDPLF